MSAGAADTVERIPADAGQLVVFESDEVDALQQLVRVVDLLSIYLFVTAVELLRRQIIREHAASAVVES